MKFQHESVTQQSSFYQSCLRHQKSSISSVQSSSLCISDSIHAACLSWYGMVLWRRLALKMISRPDSYFFGSIRYIHWVTATFGKAITLPSLFRSSPMWIIILPTATKMPVNWQQNSPCIAQWVKFSYEVLLWKKLLLCIRWLKIWLGLLSRLI